MTPTAADPRFARGVELFNAGRHFDAHEEWEHLWRECDQSDRRFVQSLIHAAVALYQWGRGNATAARTQLARGRAKAGEYPPAHLGVDAARLWADLAAALDAPAGLTAVRLHTVDTTGTADA
jgi:predicted metal-dependent hydrolase